MRLFVAVDLDESVRRAALRLARTLRERLEPSQVQASWVAPGNLHLTLKFLGEVEERLATEVRAAMAPPFGEPRFECELAGVGAFPPTGPARVLWLGISAGAEALVRLQAEVESRVRPFGFPPESRPFSAHLTVARFRTPAPTKVRELLGEGSSGPIGRCAIDHVTLYQSHLSPRGATYTPLARAPLGGSVG